MMADERAYMVMGTDAAGDIDLFATESLERAEARFQQMQITHLDVRANWLNDAP